jgi:hypothetical protein
MIPKEPEPTRSLDVPRISEKTSNAALKKWSTEYWESGRRRRVELDIIDNGKELLLGSSVDWSLVLGSISVVQEGGYGGYMQVGEAAIAVNGARFIGGLVAHAGWSMHDPQSVYLSGKYLAHIAKLEDFKNVMTLASVSYGRKTLPEAELLMKTLDLLLENPNIRRRSNLLTKTIVLLHDGNIQDAYKIVSFLEEPGSKRGPDFSKTTTSSILTPPKFGI